MATFSQYVMHFVDPEVTPFVVNPYTSNGPTFPVTTTLDTTATNARTSLLYYGKGHPNYGERLEENFMHLLESFSGSIAPVFPVSGQVWFDRAIYLNTSSGWYKWTDNSASPNDGSWASITVNIGAPPITPANGVYYFNSPTLFFGVDLPGHPLPANWYQVSYEVNTTIAIPNPATIKPKKLLRVYDGTDWRLTNTVWAATTAPANSIPGSLWFDVVAGVLSVFNGSTWVSTVGSNFVLKTGDTMTGTLVMSGAQINMTGNKIINLGTPTLGTDATTKTYVDNAISTAVGGVALTLDDLTDVMITAPISDQYLRFSAGQWVNTSILLAHISDIPVTQVELAFLSGVTSNIQTQLNTLNTNKLNLSGGTMSGILSLGGNRITNVANPVAPTDAVNLQYFTTNDKFIFSASLDVNGTLTLNRSDLVDIVIPGFAIQTQETSYFAEDNELLAQLVAPPVTVGEAVHDLDKMLRRRTTGYKSVVTSTGPGTYTTPLYQVGSQRLMVFINGLKAISSTAGFQRVLFTLVPGGSPQIQTPEQLECTLSTGLDGLGSPAVVYEATIVVNGGAPQVISITGSSDEAATMCTLVDEINAQLTGATAFLDDEAIVIISDTFGPSSTIAITDGSGSPSFPLFASIDNFSAIQAAVPGATYDYTEIGVTSTNSTSVTMISTVNGDTIEFLVLGGTGVP